MVSFAQLWEHIESNRGQSPLMTSGDDNRVLSVIRLGKDMHDENETPFWDEFISLCGDPEGLSQLLGVSRDKILEWPAKIQEMLDKLEDQIAEDPNEKEDQKVLPTGDTGAFVTNQNPM